MNEQRLKNRKRCLACHSYGVNVCPLMANADVFELDVCILEIVNAKNWNPNSPEFFMFCHHPITFLKYLSFKRQNKLPAQGDKVITLRSGYGGYGGEIRYVENVDNKHIYFTDSKHKHHYSCLLATWYQDVFVLDRNN